jgi:hypothetical protein
MVKKEKDGQCGMATKPLLSVMWEMSYLGSLLRPKPWTDMVC